MIYIYIYIYNPSLSLSIEEENRNSLLLFPFCKSLEWLQWEYRIGCVAAGRQWRGDRIRPIFPPLLAILITIVVVGQIDPPFLFTKMVSLAVEKKKEEKNLSNSILFIRTLISQLSKRRFESLSSLIFKWSNLLSWK